MSEDLKLRGNRNFSWTKQRQNSAAKKGWFRRKVSAKTNSSDFDPNDRSDSEDSTVVRRDISGFFRKSKQVRKSSKSSMFKVFTFTGDRKRSQPFKNNKKKTVNGRKNTVVEFDLDDLHVRQKPKVGNSYNNANMSMGDMNSFHVMRNSFLAAQEAGNESDYALLAKRKASQFNKTTSELFLDVDPAEDLDDAFGACDLDEENVEQSTDLNDFPQTPPRPSWKDAEVSGGEESTVDLEKTCAVSL